MIVFDAPNDDTPLPTLEELYIEIMLGIYVPPQTPCPACGLIVVRKTCVLNQRPKARKTQETFIREASVKHEGRYDYSLVKYNHALKKVTIVCGVPGHAAFDQTPANHLFGHGCPTCRASNGELSIRRFLEANNIRFAQESHIIPENSRLSYDFHLLDSVILIEFHGRQHYEPTKWFGGQKALVGRQQRDRFKSRWAGRNGYRLIVIPYTVKDIPAFLSKRLSLGLKKAA
jgi:hypothetical protein